MMPIFRVINKTEQNQFWQLQNDDTEQGWLSESLIKPHARMFKETILIFMFLRGKMVRRHDCNTVSETWLILMNTMQCACPMTI